MELNVLRKLLGFIMFWMFSPLFIIGVAIFLLIDFINDEMHPNNVGLMGYYYFIGLASFGVIKKPTL